MCGIAGVLDRTASTPRDELAAAASAMARTLAYRGPDGEATWVDEAAGVALGHRRLAVVDLSEAAAQPMTSACGRYVISFNGEIYNFGPLRQELAAAGHRFRGTGDTETFLTAISAWSYPVALERAEGMFTFALWDREERVLHLARDRMGEKPLYYGRFGPTVLFGSELKALRAHRAFRADIDRDAVADLLALKYVPAPRSIFQNVEEASSGDHPGHPGGVDRGPPRPGVLLDLAGRPSPLSPLGDLVDQAESLLSASIRARMIADVPVGAFLSGGIDSSTVVALMQRVGAPVRTFTVGFADSGFDEAHHAQVVADHLGTDHTRVDLGADEAQAVIPDLATDLRRAVRRLLPDRHRADLPGRPPGRDRLPVRRRRRRAVRWLQPPPGRAPDAPAVRAPAPTDAPWRRSPGRCRPGGHLGPGSGAGPRPTPTPTGRQQDDQGGGRPEL